MASPHSKIISIGMLSASGRKYVFAHVNDVEGREAKRVDMSDTIDAQKLLSRKYGFPRQKSRIIAGIYEALVRRHY